MGFFSVEYVIGQDNCIEMLKEEVIQAEDEKKDLSHTEQFYWTKSCMSAPNKEENITKQHDFDPWVSQDLSPQPGEVTWPF